jgi:hypothetical protein
MRIPAANTSASPRTTWIHRDSDPGRVLDVALSLRQFDVWPGPRSGAAAPSAGPQPFGGPPGAPITTEDRVRIVRALAVMTQYTVENARVQRVPALSEMDTVRELGSPVRGDMFASREHCYAASALARTWQLFTDPGEHVVHTATTLDGQPAVLSSPEMTFTEGETGLVPLLIGAVLIVAVIGASVALCYNGQAGAEILDRKLTRDDLTARMLATQGMALQLVDHHSEREVQAKAVIPYSPQEIALLDALTGTQRQIAERTQSPMPNPFQGAVESLGDAAKKAGGWFWPVVAVAGGLAVYRMTR